MKLYEEAGNLVLGSRLRRLSERILQDVSNVYRERNIPFEIAWFPIFFQLDRRESLSITELADTLKVSHPAIIQMVEKLRDKGVVVTHKDPADGRRRVVSFTRSGKKLVEEIRPVWEALDLAMQQLMLEKMHLRFLAESLTELEQTLDEKDVLTRVNEILKTHA